MSDTANAAAGRAQQAGQTAKQEASATAGQAKDAAGEVVGTAQEQARAVAGEANEQARTAVRDLRERVKDEAETQAGRTASTVRQWADDLTDLADNASEDNPARNLVSQAADSGHKAADYLDERGVGGLVEDVQGFARRRPGVFLGGAVLAGLAVGRLAKAGSKSGKGGQGSEGGNGGQGRSDGRPDTPGRTADPRYDGDRGTEGDAPGPYPSALPTEGDRLGTPYPPTYPGEV